MTAIRGDTTAPARMIADLRAAHSDDDPARAAATLARWALRPLSGGRNNAVYAWDTPNNGAVCVKLFFQADRRRVEREWHGLQHVASLDCAPRPLWLDDHHAHPVMGMTLVPGSPLAAAEAGTALKAMAETTRAMQALPLLGVLGELERVDSISHHMLRLTDQWPAQLAASPADPLAPRMTTLLRRWHDSGDADLLASPAPRVFSRGDANLLNWLHDATDATAHVVDFEFSGYGDVAVDAADHIEHISAREFPDHLWTQVEDDLGVDHDNRSRFYAAQRAIALRWLAVLWKQRDRRREEFAAQHERVEALFS